MGLPPRQINDTILKILIETFILVEMVIETFVGEPPVLPRLQDFPPKYRVNVMNTR